MSAQYNQNWTRGFGPWFTGPASDQHMRVSDAERQAVADRLAEHISSGRLDQAEVDVLVLIMCGNLWAQRPAPT